MSIAAASHTNFEAMDRLLIRGSRDEDWYIASSLNGNLCAEGSWNRWVDLAREILDEDKKRKTPGYTVQQVIL